MWKKCISKLITCLDNKMIDNETIKEFVNVVDFSLQQSKDSFSESIPLQNELLTKLIQYDIHTDTDDNDVVPKHFNELVEDYTFAQMLISEDTFEYGKAITEMIKTVTNLHASYKEKVLDTTTPLQPNVIFTPRLKSQFLYYLSIIQQELDTKPMKRIWGKSTTKPLIFSCLQKPILWLQEDITLLNKLDSLITSSAPKNTTSDAYDRATTEWSKADLPKY
ncbi:Uncharacterized protein QTN25_001139 [Entamoeba marina]